jgi:hypothetical protein
MVQRRVKWRRDPEENLHFVVDVDFAVAHRLADLLDPIVDAVGIPLERIVLNQSEVLRNSWRR